MRRPLIVNGFMATGKSTVGALVAREAGRPFIDLDLAIESQAAGAWRTCLQHARVRLPRARASLSAAHSCRSAKREEAPVVAVGGGALIARDVRLKALDECVCGESGGVAR